MILIGSCTVDIADDTTWLTLFYWPVDLKWTCQKLWQQNVVNLLDAAHMKDTHSDCILYSTASMEAVLPPCMLALLAMHLGAQVFMSHRLLGCVGMS